MPNIDIMCVDCKKEFYWKEVDQKYYAEQGFVPPKRCYTCRQTRKANSTPAEGNPIKKDGHARVAQ